MDDAVERVEISAATLAQILRELRSSPADSPDGLLFGRLHRGIKHNLQDEPLGDSPTREELVAIITGCCCPGAPFYTGAGFIDEPKLELAAGEKSRHRWGSDPLIGWFLGRSGSPMRPSMREASVTHNLCSKAPAFTPPVTKVSLVPYNGSSSSSSGRSSDEPQNGEGSPPSPPPPPFLFMLLTEAWNAVGTQEYKVFQYRTSDRTFHGRRVVIRNVGRASGSTQGEAYESFLPVAPLPWVMEPSLRGDDDDEVDSWNIVGEAAAEMMNSRSLNRRKQQRLLEMFAEKLSVEQLQEVAGNKGGARLVELLYSRMLAKRLLLVPEAQRSSRASHKQEVCNSQLRNSVYSDDS